MQRPSTTTTTTAIPPRAMVGLLPQGILDMNNARARVCALNRPTRAPILLLLLLHVPEIKRKEPVAGGRSVGWLRDHHTRTEYRRTHEMDEIRGWGGGVG